MVKNSNYYKNKTKQDLLRNILYMQVKIIKPMNFFIKVYQLELRPILAKLCKIESK